MNCRSRLRRACKLLVVTIIMLVAALLGTGILVKKPGLLKSIRELQYSFNSAIIGRIFLSMSGNILVLPDNSSKRLNYRRSLVDLEGAMRVGEGCTMADVTILQGEANPLPDGIPSFTVQIFNSCASPRQLCGLSHIHVACGWWATAKLVNPNVFRKFWTNSPNISHIVTYLNIMIFCEGGVAYLARRLAFNDCLVNDGRPLRPGQLLTFQYANSFQYPMSVKSVSTSCT